MTLEVNNLPNGISRIKLGGDLDLWGVTETETRFYAQCAGKPPRVLVDLSDVGFVGSVGIRMLLQAIKTVAAQRGRLLLLNPTKIVASALDFSGLGQHVLHGSEADAGAALLK